MDFIEERPGEYNEEYAAEYHGFVSALVLTLQLGRIPLFLCSLKFPALCHYFSLFEVLINLAEGFLFVDQGKIDITYQTLISTLNFVGFYTFRYWQLAAFTLLNPAVQMIHSYIYARPVTSETVAVVVALTALFFFTLLAAHISLAYVGMMYIKTDMLRQGNEQLLDSLQEGVIILNERNTDIKMINKAAKSLNKKMGDVI